MQRGGDERRDAAREDAGELIDEGDAGVAHPGVEELAEERGLRSVHRGVEDAEGDDDREPEHARVGARRHEVERARTTTAR